jgi:integrase/recombinase XerD
MISRPSISIFLDTRRAKANGLFPVKLRVYLPQLGKKKLYPTVFDMSEQEFASVWMTTKPRKDYQEQRRKMSAVENHAIEVSEQLKVFSFEEFEKRLFQKSGSREDVVCHYQEIIEKLRENDQFGSANSYRLSLKSLLAFAQHRSGRKATKLLFGEITKDWLVKYEYYMLNTIGRTQTTVGIYLRALRAVFNSAREQGDISTDLYPFGKKQYKIPAGQNPKKALKKEELRILHDAVSGNPEQEKARDFWFFSYYCDGINIKDIVLLRWENLQGDTLIYNRAKTANSTRSNQKLKTIYLNEPALAIIEKYCSKPRNPKALIFSIISDEMSKEQQHKAKQNFIRFVNQHLKKLAVNASLPSDISSYWARHSFVTIGIQNGIPMQMISDALHDGNMKTTLNYWKSFPENNMREFAKLKMDF